MRFDFGASARGAEWIDDLATAARERLADTVGEIVVAHSDWRAEHVRFARHKIVATYDWQSLAVGSEPVLLGQIGHGFTADWNIDQARRTPTIEEFRAFITDYESARGQRFSQAERNTIEPPGSTQPPTARVANIQTSSSGCPGRPPTPATTATAACSPVMDGSCSNEATAWREVPRRRVFPLGTLNRDAPLYAKAQGLPDRFIRALTRS